VEPRAAVREALERGERAALVTVTALEGKPPSKEGMALGVLASGERFGPGWDRAWVRIVPERIVSWSIEAPALTRGSARARSIARG